MSNSKSMLNSILIFPISTSDLSTGIAGSDDWEKITFVRERLKRIIAIKSRAQHTQDLKLELWDWSYGGLERVDFDRTPGEVLSRKMASTIPIHLLKLLGFSVDKLYRQNQSTKHPNERLGMRFSEYFVVDQNADLENHAFFFQTELTSQGQIRPFNLVAAEVLVLPEDETYAYMILHLNCTMNPTNLAKLQELNQLHNKPLKELLDTFFQVTESTHSDPFSGVQGLIPKECRTGILMSLTEGEDAAHLVDYGHLHLSWPSDPLNLARFRVRYAFLGLLVSIQRDELRKLSWQWPSISRDNLHELVNSRLSLGSFMNKWWWPQLVLNQDTQQHYHLLQSAFGIDSQLSALRTEVDDLWDVMNIQNSAKGLKSAQRLEKFIIFLTIVGLTPIWINLFESWLETVSAIGISGLVALFAFSIFRKKSA